MRIIDELANIIFKVVYVIATSIPKLIRRFSKKETEYNKKER